MRRWGRTGEDSGEDLDDGRMGVVVPESFEEPGVGGTVEGREAIACDEGFAGFDAERAGLLRSEAEEGFGRVDALGLGSVGVARMTEESDAAVSTVHGTVEDRPVADGFAVVSF